MKPIYKTRVIPKTLLVGIHAPYNRTESVDSYFEEFKNLVKTNRVVFDHITIIRLRSVDSSFLLTKGKLADLKELCDELEIEEVIFSDSLSPQQERNLSDFLDCKVYDRTQLILEIFEKAAHTAEGKTQVTIAMLQHQKTRLAGKGIHMSQQAGIKGVRGGPGETVKEKETRYVNEQIYKHKRTLKKIAQARETQRKRRLSSGLPQMCLIGYTNAGKSTILNALTHSDVLAADKLFATLDTTTRELYINHDKKGLISDTVGFIQQLPHKLIEAFKSTLSELQYADLLLHVVDISDPSWQEHIKVVHKILEELNVEKEMLYIFNKSDNIDPQVGVDFSVDLYQPHIIISAHCKDGIDKLKQTLADWQPAR